MKTKESDGTGEAIWKKKRYIYKGGKNTFELYIQDFISMHWKLIFTTLENIF